MDRRLTSSLSFIAFLVEAGTSPWPRAEDLGRLDRACLSTQRLE